MYAAVVYGQSGTKLGYVHSGLNDSTSSKFAYDWRLSQFPEADTSPRRFLE